MEGDGDDVGADTPRLTAVAALAVLAACSDAGRTPSRESFGRVHDQDTGPFTKVAKRGPDDIGAGTRSATLASAANGTGVPLSQKTVTCASTCSATASLDPRTYSFTVSLYNGPNNTGSVLSWGSARKAVVAGTANVVDLSVSGSIVKANVTMADPVGNGVFSV